MKMPVLFLSHGGGPWHIMETGQTYDVMRAALASLPQSLPAPPQAILTVSAHWEEPQFCVATNAQPGMLYDYYGFPKHTYELQYNAPGAPGLARQVLALLAQHGVAANEHASRDFDHGVFVPLMVM
jgi:aromatic ring-opening dioxygenase catalytic subunit (LigB family)